jgi:hypothetical protein
VSKADSHGTPSRFWRAMESYCRLREGVTLSALARFKGLDPFRLKQSHGLFDAAIQFARDRGTGTGLIHRWVRHISN